MKRFAVIGGLVAAFLLVLSVAWVGGEVHYGNCLASVDLRYPSAYSPPTGEKAQLQEELGISPGKARFVYEGSKYKRANEISACSRWP